MRDGSKASPTISVVVPCWRSEATIGRCIAALRDQRSPPDFEVIVVDSSPDEATALAARAANPPGPGTLDLALDRAPDRLFPGAARNRGAALARAPWLLFLDSDCVASSDLLEVAAGFAESGPGVFGGSIALPGGAPASARIRHLLEFKESLPGVPARATWQIPSACMLVDRAVFELHGGFPGTRASEDVPEGAVIHHRERGFGEFSRSFRLPFRIDASGVDARYQHGVLEVKLPKAAEDRPRKVPVLTA